MRGGGGVKFSGGHGGLLRRHCRGGTLDPDVLCPQDELQRTYSRIRSRERTSLTRPLTPLPSLTNLAVFPPHIAPGVLFPLSTISLS